MRIYFTDAQVPELSELPFSQRWIVRREGYAMFRRENPAGRTKVRLVNSVTLIVALVLANAREFQAKAHHGWWIDFLLAMSWIVAIHLPFQSYLTELLRPYFRRVLTTRQNELGQVGE